MARCPLCGERRLRRGFTDRAIAVGRVAFVARLRAERCSACGEALVADADLERFELHAAQWLASVGVATPEAFRFMRKALGLRLVDLAELLGVRLETVSRWETGAIPVEHRAVALLGAMVADRLEGKQDTRARLEALRSPAKVPREVRLKVA